MTGPLEVDVQELEGASRQLAVLSDQLCASVIHEWQPAAPQPTGKATVAVTAAGNHVLTECGGNLLVVAEQLAQAARDYASRDADEARRIAATVLPPK